MDTLPESSVELTLSQNSLQHCDIAIIQQMLQIALHEYKVLELIYIMSQ